MHHITLLDSDYQDHRALNDKLVTIASKMDFVIYRIELNKSESPIFATSKVAALYP